MRKKGLREKILQLVERYGESNTKDAPLEEGTSVIPPSRKVIGGNELKMMADAVLDGWLTTGRFNP